MLRCNMSLVTCQTLLMLRCNMSLVTCQTLLNATLQHVSCHLPDALDATLQHVSCHLPDALDATLQHVVTQKLLMLRSNLSLVSLPEASWCYADNPVSCLCQTLLMLRCNMSLVSLPDVPDATLQHVLLSLARRSWCYAATCLLSLARRKCFQVNHVKMEFTRKTHKRGHKTHGTQCIDKKWSALKRYIQRNCVLRRPMDCWMKKMPSMCTVLSGDPIHLERTRSKA